MLKRLRIRNFQRHDNLDLVLDPSITTIVGPSDIGKSAILRALRWVCFNKPDGNGFIRHGQDTCKVQVEVDGHKITRTRDKTKNTYTLDGKVLHSFSRGVPDLVERCLRLGDVNFQLQHDAPYWFALTASDVSKQINSIVDLRVVDEALGIVQKEQRDTTAQAKAAHNNLRESTAELKRLEFVPEIVAAYSEVEGLEADLDTTASQIQRVARPLERAKLLAGRLERVTTAAKRAAKLQKLLSVHLETAQKRKRIQSLVARASEAQTALARPQPDVAQCCKIYDEWIAIRRRRDNVDSTINHANSLTTQLCDTKTNLQKVLKKLPPTCPTCGSLTKSTTS